MLFLTHWELNENMSVEQPLQIAQKLTASGLFPPKGVKMIRWDYTPDAWGILIFEAENLADAVQTIDIWRASGAGFFKSIKTSPAMPVQEVIPLEAELLKTLAST